MIIKMIQEIRTGGCLKMACMLTYWRIFMGFLLPRIIFIKGFLLKIRILPMCLTKLVYL